MKEQNKPQIPAEVYEAIEVSIKVFEETERDIQFAIDLIKHIDNPCIESAIRILTEAKEKL